jgi:hypothetical protein
MAAIDRLPTKHSYDLDVMVFNEDKLWPTWLSVPTVTNEVEKVRVTLRSVGTANAVEGAKGFSGGDGGPPLIVWAFYDLLIRFILGIPYDRRTPRKDKFLKHDVSIKLLELDIRSPNVPANMIARDIAYNRLHERRRRDGIDYLMNPAFLAKFLERHLRSLLQGHIAEYGRLLYERIGTINVYLDGEILKEWNIGNLLATLKLDHFVQTFEYPKPQPADHRKLFENWRLSVHNSRKKFGLPTMPFGLEDNSCWN